MCVCVWGYVRACVRAQACVCGCTYVFVCMNNGVCGINTLTKPTGQREYVSVYVIVWVCELGSVYVCVGMCFVLCIANCVRVCAYILCGVYSVLYMYM